MVLIRRSSGQGSASESKHFISCLFSAVNNEIVGSWILLLQSHTSTPLWLKFAYVFATISDSPILQAAIICKTAYLFVICLHCDNLLVGRVSDCRSLRYNLHCF